MYKILLSSFEYLPKQAQPRETNKLEFCKNDIDKIAIKFFETFFCTYSNKSEVLHLKLRKTFAFRQSFFATKIPEKT